MRYTFEKIWVKRTKRWTENGRKRQETKTFSQTLNPFNVIGDRAKTRAEIWHEINAEADEWMKR